MTAQDRADCAVLSALLSQGAVVNRLSGGLTLLSLLALGAAALLSARAPALAALPVLALGLLQAFLAARVALDAALFQALAQGVVADLPALDGALRNLALAPAAKLGRPLPPRMAGARRLLRLQLLAFLAQLAALLAAAFALA